MTTTAWHERTATGWIVVVDWGFTQETHGPYRFQWLARLIAWSCNGEH